jgi:hypothetical protein
METTMTANGIGSESSTIQGFGMGHVEVFLFC